MQNGISDILPETQSGSQQSSELRINLLLDDGNVRTNAGDGTYHWAMNDGGLLLRMDLGAIESRVLREIFLDADGVHVQLQQGDSYPDSRFFFTKEVR